MERRSGAVRTRVLLILLAVAIVGASPVGMPEAGAKKPTTTTTSKPTTTTTRPATTTTTTTTLPPTTTTVPPTTSTSTTFPSTTSSTIARPRVPNEAVAYHQNAQHTGSAGADPIAPDLVPRWSKTWTDWSAELSYPVIAEGKVFVVAAEHPLNTAKLYAFDLQTGAPAWGPVGLGGRYEWAALTYDNWRLYALNSDGVLRAFTAANGDVEWTLQLSGQTVFNSPPVARDGIVYAIGEGSGGTLYSVHGMAGVLLWSRPAGGMNAGSPAVTDTDIYVSSWCPILTDMDLQLVQVVWEYRAGCRGSWGSTPVVNQGRVWARDQSGDVVLDAETGALTGTFTAGPIPAFDDTAGYFLNGTVLSARSLATGAALWTFSGDGQLTTAPIAAGGHVYVGSAGGNVYVLRGATGEVLATLNVGAAVPAPNETIVGYPLPGMAVGLGHLVVPADSGLFVFGSP